MSSTGKQCRQTLWQDRSSGELAVSHHQFPENANKLIFNSLKIYRKSAPLPPTLWGISYWETSGPVEYMALDWFSGLTALELYLQSARQFSVNRPINIRKTVLNCILTGWILKNDWCFSFSGFSPSNNCRRLGSAW